MLIDQIETVCV